MIQNIKLEKVFFYPKVGSKYETEGFNGLKLLILGESHYCNEGDDYNEFTIEVLDEYLEYKNGIREHKKWMNTFTRFTNVIFEDKVDNKTLKDFWDSVIFYNYVQSSTRGPRTPPTYEQFKESEEAFNEILEQYEPDLIIAWGKRLWNNLPKNGIDGEENILDNGLGQFYYYTIGEKKIPALGVHHPSTSSFNYNFSKYLKEAMRLVIDSK